MANFENQYQNDDRLLDLRIKLDTKLKKYLQTKNDSNEENKPLGDFLREINTLSVNDKKIYQNYVGNLIRKVDTSFIQDISDDLKQLNKLDLLNAWRGIENNIKENYNNNQDNYGNGRTNDIQNNPINTDWTVTYKDQNPTEVESKIEQITEGEYKITIDEQEYKIIYNGGKYALLSRMTYNKAIGKFPVIIGNGGTPYSNIEIDTGGGFKFNGTVEFDSPNTNKVKVDNLLLGNKRVSSEINKIGENIYSLNIDNNQYDYIVKYNPVSNSIQIIDGDNNILYKGTAHPINLKGNNIIETRFGEAREKKEYIIGIDFNIKIGGQNLTGTIIVPK